MKNGIVSIILPVYNGAKYVENSIKSVLNQTYRNIELIIVNDCSTDNTLDIITAYKNIDERIVIINNENNLKLPRSLNEGFKRATGEFYSWTSDDNMYHSTAIEKMVQVMEREKEIELVYTDFSIVDMNGNILGEVKEGEPSEIRFRDNIGACFLYRSSLAKKVGEYNPEMFLAEDYDFFIRCYEKSDGHFFHIPEDLYDYGRHEQNLSATKKNHIAKKAFDVMMHNYEFLYSQCESRNDKNQFFYELLALLRDEKEIRKQRMIFYKKDIGFAFGDLKHRMINRLTKNCKKGKGISNEIDQ